MCCTIDNKNILITWHDIPSNANELNNEDMNRKEEVYREAFCWTDTAKLFLSLYKENIDLLVQRKIKTKKILQKISEKMKMQSYNVSAIQVENKYKSLERSYKMELAELLGGKHNIEPLLLSGNKGIILKNDSRSTSL
ncbi:hypothetical protein P5V15_014738 [Pogonomyrmex californicus]